MILLVAPLSTMQLCKTSWFVSKEMKSGGTLVLAQVGGGSLFYNWPMIVALICKLTCHFHVRT